MSALLCEMNKARKELISQEISSFPKGTVLDYEKKYHAIIERGRDENKRTSHRYAKKDEKALLNRMEKYSHNHLLFLHDFSVPFDESTYSLPLIGGSIFLVNPGSILIINQHIDQFLKSDEEQKKERVRKHNITR